MPLLLPSLPKVVVREICVCVCVCVCVCLCVCVCVCVCVPQGGCTSVRDAGAAHACHKQKRFKFCFWYKYLVLGWLTPVANSGERDRDRFRREGERNHDGESVPRNVFSH
jgi:hypothetical protein